MARSLWLSRDNTFDLLAALGGDCAGAVTLLPPGDLSLQKGTYRPISAEDLAEELAHLPTHPFLADEDGVRLSLAGAQNKLPISPLGSTKHSPPVIIDRLVGVIEQRIAKRVFSCPDFSHRPLFFSVKGASLLLADL